MADNIIILMCRLWGNLGPTTSWNTGGRGAIQACILHTITICSTVMVFQRLLENKSTFWNRIHEDLTTDSGTPVS
jgi:hypothetical protein